MPTGTLPTSGKKLWEEVYNKAKTGSCKDSADVEACAAGSAWKAVKNAGWHKGADGTWTKKAVLSEFSMAITKASYDKTTNEMRWLASASDTQEDSYGDNMTLGLFQDFLQRIESNEQAPEAFRSDFWQGGMPYLSVSHYPDFNGAAVPGNVEVTYIDGDNLKAKGTYSDTPLGRACWKAVCADLYGTEKSDTQDRVRISIAFLDWMHKHKSTGYLFERKSLEDFCPECLREMITGEYGGKEYLKGQLVHYAHTRVPVNKRTLMEVDKSMTTRKEDAASIIGEELADELEEQNKLVGKSEALVIKADEETPEPIVEEAKMKDKKHMDDEESEDMMDEEDAADEQGKSYKKKKDTKKSEAEDEVLVEEAVMKKEGGCGHPSSHFLVVEDSTKPTTWHLRYKNCSGEVDNRLLGAAKAALTSPGGHRGNKYEGPGKEGAVKKLKSLYKSQGLDWESKSDVEFEDEVLETIKAGFAELKATLTPEPAPSHPLQASLDVFKSDYDTALKMTDVSPDDKLRLIQQSFDALGRQVIETIKTPQPEPEPSPINDMAKAFSEALQPLMKEVSLLNARLGSLEAKNVVAPVNTQPVQPVVPQRRSIAPTLTMQSQARTGISPGVAKSETPGLRAIIEKTT